MEVSYKLTADDYSNYVKCGIITMFSFKNLVKNIRIIIFLFVIGFFFTGFVFSSYVSLIEKKNFVIILLEFTKGIISFFSSIDLFLIIFASFFILLYFFGGYLLRPDGIIYETVDLLTPDYFLQKTYYGEEKTFWHGFINIFQNNNFIILNCN